MDGGKSNRILWLIPLVVFLTAGAVCLVFLLTTRSTVLIRTTPAGVTVRIDEKIVGVTTDSALAVDVSPGDVTLTLDRDGYSTERVMVRVRRGRVVEITQLMRPPGMIYVKGGRFAMGTNDGTFGERPVHEVTLGPYYIDRTEVTVSAFRAHDSGYVPSFEGDALPATNIAWKDADDFCRAIGKRLPTEAEWERACSGVAGRSYAYGDSYDTTRGRSGVALREGPIAVASYAADDEGAVDLTGNVWEWTADWYDRDYYKSSPASNPGGPARGERHVLRGGAWYSNASFSKCTHRPGNVRSQRDPSFGFRCVQDPH